MASEHILGPFLYLEMKGFFLWPSATSEVNLYRKYTTSIFLQIEVLSITQHLGYKMHLSIEILSL